MHILKDIGRIISDQKESKKNKQKNIEFDHKFAKKFNSTQSEMDLFFSHPFKFYLIDNFTN